MLTNSYFEKLLSFYFPKCHIIESKKINQGNINDTYFISFSGQQSTKIILQKINTDVFDNCQSINHNLSIFNKHLDHKIKQNHQFLSKYNIHFPTLVSQFNRHYKLIEYDGFLWRALNYIDNSSSIDYISSSSQANQLGLALGLLHYLLYDMPIDNIYTTINNFHVTSYYLQSYDRLKAKATRLESLDSSLVKSRVDQLSKFITDHLYLSNYLTDPIEDKLFNLVPIHGDPKVNNFLFDPTLSNVIGIIDFDTLQPGIILYDIADAIRSCSNKLGENTIYTKDVHFETSFFQEFLSGYLTFGRYFLSENDFKYLFKSILLMPFELGIRFFTDFLNGNKYFKVTEPLLNILRAENQFQLTSSIIKKSNEIQVVISDHYDRFSKLEY